MELKTWVKLEPGRATKLASFLTSKLHMIEPGKSVTTAQVTAWCADESQPSWRPIPPWAAPGIDEFTEGSVKRWDTRPKDWFVLWPELLAGHRVASSGAGTDQAITAG